MAGRDEFLAHVLGLLEPLGRVHARGMFGGHGLYCDGVFFGIVLDNTLYLKTDARNRGEFERAGSEIFSYSRKGQSAKLNFCPTPERGAGAPFWTGMRPCRRGGGRHHRAPLLPMHSRRPRARGCAGRAAVHAAVGEKRRRRSAAVTRRQVAADGARGTATQLGRNAFTASMKARGFSICGQCPQPGISRNFAPGIPFASARARAGGVV